jgi:hypothetical protein
VSVLSTEVCVQSRTINQARLPLFQKPLTPYGSSVALRYGMPVAMLRKAPTGRHTTAFLQRVACDIGSTTPRNVWFLGLHTAPHSLLPKYSKHHSVLRSYHGSIIGVQTLG